LFGKGPADIAREPYCGGVGLPLSAVDAAARSVLVPSIGEFAPAGPRNGDVARGVVGEACGAVAE